MSKRKSHHKASGPKIAVCGLCGELLSSIGPGFNLDTIVRDSLKLPGRNLDLHHVVPHQLRDDFREAVKVGRLSGDQLVFAGHSVTKDLMVVVHPACHKQFNQLLAWVVAEEVDEDQTEVDHFLQHFPRFGLFCLTPRKNRPSMHTIWVPATHARPRSITIAEQALEDGLLFEVHPNLKSIT